MAPGRTLRGATAELLLWGVPCSVFLAVYIGLFDRAPAAVWAHTAVLLILVGAIAFNLDVNPHETNNQIAQVPTDLRFRWFREVGANLTLSGPTQVFPDLTITGK